MKDMTKELEMEELSKIDLRRGLVGDVPYCIGGDERQGKPDILSRILAPEVEAAKMEFCRRMKMPNKGTESKEGCPYGGIRYGAFDKFKP